MLEYLFHFVFRCINDALCCTGLLGRATQAYRAKADASSCPATGRSRGGAPAGGLRTVFLGPDVHI
jgi:hypothetical protein